MRHLLVPALLALSLLPLSHASAAPSHPFDVHDLIALERLSEPRVAPDGKSAVFTVSSLDLAANKRRTDLWLVGTDGSGLRQLTRDTAADTSGAWSPEGRSIYFLSTRSGSAQVWKLPLAGGEAQQLTALPLDVGSFVLSPDGTGWSNQRKYSSGSLMSGHSESITETPPSRAACTALSMVLVV